MYFILFLFTVVKMRAPSKGGFILSTESTVSGMGLEEERLEDFLKRYDLPGTLCPPVGGMQ